jgi:hypothetical protein
MKNVALTMAAIVLTVLALPTTTVWSATFDDTAAGDWTTAGTWTTGSGYPQYGDNVIKDDAIQIDVTSDQEFGDSSNDSTFSAGTINIGSGSTLTHLAGSTLNYTGLTTLTGAGTLANEGTFTTSGSGQEVHLYSAGFTFANTGTFIKGTASHAWTRILGASGGGVFTSDGGAITSPNNGRLIIRNASDGPAWSISNTTMNAGTGQFELGGVWSSIGGVGTGTIMLEDQSGTARIYAAPTGLNLNVTGSGLLANNNGGRTAQIMGNGNTVTNDGIIKTLDGQAKLGIEDGTFVNNGQMYVQNTVRFGAQLDNHIAATNSSTGTIYLINNSGSTKDLLYVGSGSSVINDGTIVKQGADDVLIDAEGFGGRSFTNNGTIRIQQGTLKFQDFPSANLTFKDTSVFEFELEDLAGKTEMLMFTADIALDGTVTAIDNGMDTGVWYKVISMDSGLSLTDAGLTAGADTLINVVGGTDGYVEVQLVPEPATMGLLALGSLALLRRRRC